MNDFYINVELAEMTVQQYVENEQVCTSIIPYYNIVSKKLRPIDFVDYWCCSDRDTVVDYIYDNMKKFIDSFKALFPKHTVLWSVDATQRDINVNIGLIETYLFKEYENENEED